MNEILSINKWPTNAHLIKDIQQLGYLNGHIFDATYGQGIFWNEYKPQHLTTNDLNKPADKQWDWTKPPTPDLQQYDTVVFDPPYKLNGTPTDSDRYGINIKQPIQQKIDSIINGATNCKELVKPGGYLLVKCQNQVACGKMYWQTDLITNTICNRSWIKDAEFMFLHNPRPQRSQKRARNNYSTLMIFKHLKHQTKEQTT